MYVVNKGRRTGLVEIQTTVRLTILKLALELNIIDVTLTTNVFF
jgi:hypothetical protein